MAAAGSDCALVNVPVQTGAAGDRLRSFLVEDVIPHRPADLTFRRVSRTVDQRRVVDEASVEFTHDRELPWQEAMAKFRESGWDIRELVVAIATSQSFAQPRIEVSP